MDIIRKRGAKPASKHTETPIRPTSDSSNSQPILQESVSQLAQEPADTVVAPEISNPETTQTGNSEDAAAPGIADIPVDEEANTKETTSVLALTENKKPRQKAATKTVEIKISLPAMPNLKPITEHPAYTAAMLRTQKLPRKKLALGGIVLTIVLFIASSYLLPDRDSNVAADKQGSRYGLTRGIPDYPTILPAGKTIQDLGGWTLVSPPDRDPAFAYVDAIGNTQINVSQQPLPDDLKPDTTEKIENLAKAYSANEKITIDGMVVYIGTSEKGPQSVIFSKNDLLILIKSSVRIDSNEWAKYVNSLK